MQCEWEIETQPMHTTTMAACHAACGWGHHEAYCQYMRYMRYMHFAPLVVSPQEQRVVDRSPCPAQLWEQPAEAHRLHVGAGMVGWVVADRRRCAHAHGTSFHILSWIPPLGRQPAMHATQTVTVKLAGSSSRIDCKPPHLATPAHEQGWCVGGWGGGGSQVAPERTSIGRRIQSRWVAVQNDDWLVANGSGSVCCCSGPGFSCERPLTPTHLARAVLFLDQ